MPGVRAIHEGQQILQATFQRVCDDAAAGVLVRIEGAKEKVLWDLCEFHGDGLAEAIGLYVNRLETEVAGRENGILFFGKEVGTGKSTIALALSHISSLHGVLSYPRL